MSARQFDRFRASSLFCPKCGEARPVREKLLLVLPDRELHEYTCETCGGAVGTREVTAADRIADEMARRQRSSGTNPRRQVRIL